MGKSKTKTQKKAREEAHQVAEHAYRSVPHSFVFHRGQIGKNVGQLVMDMRKVMQPFTAESLKVRKNNVLKDFASVAGPLGVSHFIIFGKTPNSVTMRVARLPKGPMLYFKVLKYSLVKDVISSLKKHRMHEQQFTHHPLLILSNFGMDGMHVKLMATMFQHMFPSINVQRVNLNDIKRCVLLHFNPESQEIQFRHYSLKVVPVGMSRGVKKLMLERFPNMNKFEDISELLMTGANLSESEAEQDGDYNITELPQIYSGRGNMASQQSAVRLTEIGPRMTLQLIKIQEGMGDGNILYHSLITKTEEEIQEILKRKEAQIKEKGQRQKQQEQNIAQKKAKREEHKKKSLEGIKRKLAEAEEDSEVEDPGVQDDKAAVESDDDVEYYRQAVGEEPDEDMFPSAKKRRRSEKSHKPTKKGQLSPVVSSKETFSKSPNRKGAGGQSRDRMGKDRHGKGWKKSKDEEKTFGKKKFSPKSRDEKTFGKKKFSPKSRDEKTFGKKKFSPKSRDEKTFGKKKFSPKSRDEEKTFGKKKFPPGKAFGFKKGGERENKYGGKKFGDKKNKDKSFRSKGQKNQSGFKNKGAGRNPGFSQKKRRS